MSVAYLNTQAGVAASGTAIAGDVTGTLAASVVAKVAGVTPGAGGLALLDDATMTAILATIAASGVPGVLATGKVGLPTIYIQTSDLTESAGSLSASADMIAPVVAGASYVVAVVMLGVSAAVATGLQWAIVGPGNNAFEAEGLHAPTGTTSETQINGAMGAAVASTGSPSGPVPLIDFGWAAFTAHASAPSPATVGVSIKTEVAASAVTVKAWTAMMLVWRTH